MKMACLISFLLLTGSILAQPPSWSLSFQASHNNIADPAALSATLTQHLTSEKEKVTAIFRWITGNIAYQAPDKRSIKKKNPPPMAPDDEESGALPPLTERIARTVLQKKKAVCEGYARLFKSLCDHAGIQSVIITGYARADMNRPEIRFHSNHAWNAVCIDSNWYLLDATWASGYIVLPSNEFVKQYDPYYFLTAPEQFIRHHLPDDMRWALLDKIPPIAEFKTTPFRPRSYSKYAVQSYTPAQGVINAAAGDTIRFTLQLDLLRSRTDIAPDSIWEEASMNETLGWAAIHPDNVQGSTAHYYYVVPAAKVEWLHLLYNNDAILRYRINSKKTTAVAVVK